MGFFSASTFLCAKRDGKCGKSEEEEEESPKITFSYRFLILFSLNNAHAAITACFYELKIKHERLMTFA